MSALVIPQTNPKASYLAHQAAIDMAISQVLASGWYILGEQVAGFEREFAAYLGSAHAIGVANGTDAIHLALRACDIGPGDLVFTVSHTAVATVAAIEMCGATPVLVDIDPVTYTMDPTHLDDAIRHAPPGVPRAIVPVHLYGHPADMDAILAIAQRYNLRVIEDCAQAHGATYHGQTVGTFGDLAAFSCYPTKNLGALGDAGIVVTQDAQLAAQVRALREYGWRARYVSDMPGVNSRLDEMQAAVLRAKLPCLDADNARRHALAAAYTEHLAASGLTLPTARPDCTHAYHQYVVRTAERDALQRALREQGIGTLVHYPVPVHLQPAYRDRIALGDSLANTEKICAQILSVPMFPELSLTDVQTVSAAIRAWLSSGISS